MISTPLAGTLTIVFLVAFGIFIYPLLFRRRGGFLVVAVLTVALAALFHAFDAGTGTARATSAALGLTWALLPVATGLLVWYLQRKKARAGGA
jgi:hypothetical protein